MDVQKTGANLRTPDSASFSGGIYAKRPGMEEDSSPSVRESKHPFAYEQFDPDQGNVRDSIDPVVEEYVPWNSRLETERRLAFLRHCETSAQDVPPGSARLRAVEEMFHNEPDMSEVDFEYLYCTWLAQHPEDIPYDPEHDAYIEKRKADFMRIGWERDSNLQCSGRTFKIGRRQSELGLLKQRIWPMEVGNADWPIAVGPKNEVRQLYAPPSTTTRSPRGTRSRQDSCKQMNELPWDIIQTDWAVPTKSPKKVYFLDTTEEHDALSQADKEEPCAPNVRVIRLRDMCRVCNPVTSPRRFRDLWRFLARGGRLDGEQESPELEKEKL